MPTLDCAACALKLEKLINKQPDVISASISYATKTLKLTAEDPDSLIPELTEKCNEIESPTVIQKPHAKLEENSSHGILDWIKQDKVQLGIGGIIFGAGMILNYNLINLPVTSGNH
ncbi:cation transporter [Dialister hominis]|uniref:cation transporter n=1 Tax=Dialister hominis TaxID=2582419 RepID=UPI003520AA3F